MGKMVHGMASRGCQHPLYSVWHGIKARCYNKNVFEYQYYGARGITVDESWKNSFANFVNDMGERPAGFTIDRIDNSKGYSKENCRWISMHDQVRNRRSNVVVEMDGKKWILKDLCKELGLSYKMIRQRISDRGWPVEKAFSTKPKITKQNKHLY